MPEYKTLTFKISPEQHKRIKIFAAEKGVTIKDLLIGCVERMMEGEDNSGEGEQ